VGRIRLVAPAEGLGMSREVIERRGIDLVSVAEL
jgi:hypothetical protein